MMRWTLPLLTCAAVTGCTADRLPDETLTCRASQQCTEGDCTPSNEVFNVQVYEGEIEFEPDLILNAKGMPSALAFESRTSRTGFYDSRAMSLSEVFHTLTAFKSSDGAIRLTLIQDQLLGGLPVELSIDADGQARKLFASCVSERGETV